MATEDTLTALYVTLLTPSPSPHPPCTLQGHMISVLGLPSLSSHPEPPISHCAVPQAPDLPQATTSQWPLARVFPSM